MPIGTNGSRARTWSHEVKGHGVMRSQLKVRQVWGPGGGIILDSLGSSRYSSYFIVWFLISCRIHYKITSAMTAKRVMSFASVCLSQTYKLLSDLRFLGRFFTNRDYLPDNLVRKLFVKSTRGLILTFAPKGVLLFRVQCSHAYYPLIGWLYVSAWSGCNKDRSVKGREKLVKDRFVSLLGSYSLNIRLSTSSNAAWRLTFSSSPSARLPMLPTHWLLECCCLRFSTTADFVRVISVCIIR